MVSVFYEGTAKFEPAIAFSLKIFQFLRKINLLVEELLLLADILLARNGAVQMSVKKPIQRLLNTFDLILKEGLVYNKVKSQVNMPNWIFSRREFMEAFLRGFFDTDGSVYSLRFGIQISFTNRSIPILQALQRMLEKLEYNPSKVSGFHLYITRREEINRFFQEVRPRNSKHQKRFVEFQKRVGTQVVNGGRL